MAGAKLGRSYEDFEPYCKWKKEQEKDTFEIHLNGFKKEELRVQLTSLGNLIITGERELGKGKWTRFRKETIVDKDCDVNSVRAKFTGGVLYVSLPKKSSSTATTAPVSPSPNELLPLQGDNRTSNEGERLEDGDQQSGTAGYSLWPNHLIMKLMIDKKMAIKAVISVAVILLVALLINRFVNLG